MNIKEFNNKITGLAKSYSHDESILHKENAMQFVITIGEFVGENYCENNFTDRHQMFLDAIKMLDARGAKAGVDYAVFVAMDTENQVLLLLATTDVFMSGEDFPNVKEVWS